MLILTRRPQESLVIPVNGVTIKIRVLGMKGRQVRIGVEAPKSIEVHREEVYERIQRGETMPERQNPELSVE